MSEDGRAHIPQNIYQIPRNIHHNLKSVDMAGFDADSWKPEFQDTGRFFRDATVRLCGTLRLDVALSDFYSFLNKTMGVTGIMIGRILFEKREGTGIAYCDDSGVSLLNTRFALSLHDACMAEAGLLRKEAEDGFLITSPDDPAARFLCAQSLWGLKPPFFFLRMRSGTDFWVGATFCCAPDKSFTPAQMDQLRELRAPLLMTLSNCLRYWELEELQETIVRENLDLRSQLAQGAPAGVIGVASGLATVMKEARLVGATDVPALVSGETGSGKEVIAQAVHQFSARAKAPFVAVNCGAIPASLIDSELFGHAKGAFTGATGDHKGYFEQARGGTLFLDEIGELPLDVQARLLRVLQDGHVRRVGGDSLIPLDFRLIAATHRDLRRMVAEGKFREDLFYRLRVVELVVPPLRERKEDIMLLVIHFIHAAARRYGIIPPALGAGERERLLAHSWPGNVRELRNVVEEAMVLNPQGPLILRIQSDSAMTTAQGIVDSLGEAHGEVELSVSAAPEAQAEWFRLPAHAEKWPTMDEVQTQYLEKLLQSCHGRISGPFGAAVKAGVNANTMRFRLGKLGIRHGAKGG